MYFDREALKGIYWSLSVVDRIYLDKHLMELGIKTVVVDGRRMIADEGLYIVQEEMVRLGFIIPFEVSIMEAVADEYDEIMLAEKLVGDSISFREG